MLSVLDRPGLQTQIGYVSYLFSTPGEALGRIPMFKAKSFLVEMFGNVQGLLSFLGAYDAPLPNAGAVEKWFQRGSIPSDWLPVLLAYLELDRGGPVSLSSYLGNTP